MSDDHKDVLIAAYLFEDLATPRDLSQEEEFEIQ